jgi:TM2 domain-containing membrane protein YozV
MKDVLTVLIVFGSITAIAIVIGLARYFAKQLEHKQIMAAIEKGTPLSELRLPRSRPAGTKWIGHLTVGIVVLAVAFAFGFSGLPCRLMGGISGKFFVAIILCGVGIASIVRGLLYRKYYPKGQAANNNNKENKSQ